MKHEAWWWLFYTAETCSFLVHLHKGSFIVLFIVTYQYCIKWMKHILNASNDLLQRTRVNSNCEKIKNKLLNNKYFTDQVTSIVMTKLREWRPENLSFFSVWEEFSSPDPQDRLFNARYNQTNIHIGLLPRGEKVGAWLSPHTYIHCWRRKNNEFINPCHFLSHGVVLN